MQKNILLIDDEAEIRDLLAAQLLADNRTFLMASNGLEAIEILKNNEIDLIISDMAMPKMNGFELLRKLKLMAFKAPVIILTGHADSLVANQLRTYSVKHFLNKPWSRVELETIVSELVKN